METNKMKHTEGEWKIEKRTKMFDSCICCEGKIIGFPAGSPQDEANIEHIVKCVNMHDGLVRKMKLFIEYADWTLNFIDKEEGITLKEFIENSKQLLKQAEQ